MVEKLFPLMAQLNRDLLDGLTPGIQALPQRRFRFAGPHLFRQAAAVDPFDAGPLLVQAEPISRHAFRQLHHLSGQNRAVKDQANPVSGALTGS